MTRRGISVRIMIHPAPDRFSRKLLGIYERFIIHVDLYIPSLLGAFLPHFSMVRSEKAKPSDDGDFISYL
jgi:hypothetical protein